MPYAAGDKVLAKEAFVGLGRAQCSVSEKLALPSFIAPIPPRMVSGAREATRGLVLSCALATSLGRLTAGSQLAVYSPDIGHACPDTSKPSRSTI